MKITSTYGTQAVTRTERAAPTKAVSPAAPASGDRLSTVGTVVSELRSKAAEHGIEGDVRPDVVAEMKAEFKAGRLGSHADVERAIDALLREL